MVKVKNFIGIDVSKKTFDAALIKNLNRQTIIHEQFENSRQGLKAFTNWLTAQGVSIDDSTVVCMEHTGIYNYSILEYLLETPVLVWLEMALQIKQSLGIQRGKSDKLDAIRIARYAYKEREDIKVWKPVNSIINSLKLLMAQRDRIVSSLTRLTVPVEELKSVGQLKEAQMLERLQKSAVRELQKTLKKIEQQIELKLKEDEGLYRLYQYADSVCGIGEVIATKLVICTHGFTRLTDYKKMATYCGVAPFEHTSGTSVKKPSRTHHMANMDLKSTLSMGAKSAINYDPEIKLYAQRKTAEGKSYAWIKTAVSNKLLKRVLSCVNNQRMYVKKQAA
jgi:transposase